MKVTSISPASRHRSLISISGPAGHDKDWPGHTERRGRGGPNKHILNSHALVKTRRGIWDDNQVCFPLQSAGKAPAGQVVQLLPRKGSKSKFQLVDTCFSLQDKKKLTRDVISLVLARGPKMCSFIEYKDDLKIVYKRYARCILVLSGKGKPKPWFSLLYQLHLKLVA